MNALEQELEALRRENRLLKQRLLQTDMEKALTDDALSRSVRQELGAFFSLPGSGSYVMLLFYGRRPGESHRKPPEDPVAFVKQRFSEVLRPFGEGFFFAPPGGVGCLLHLHAAETALGDIKAALESAMTPESTTEFICLSEISTMEHGPRMLYRSAVAVSEHRMQGSPSVCSPEDIPEADVQDSGKLYLLEMKFWQQIQKQEFYQAAGTLDKLIAYSRQQNGFLERAQAVVFSRLELVLHTLGTQTEEKQIRDEELTELMPAISRTKTYQELRELSYDILAVLEDKFYTPADARNRKMVNIERFVRSHFADQSLGAAQLSEEFKISPSYLSRIFKADMGMSVVDFIHRVRIDEAKRLLEQTEENVGDIAASVGFSNQWVFIRAFKRWEGVTPGAYRESLAI